MELEHRWIASPSTANSWGCTRRDSSQRFVSGAKRTKEPSRYKSQIANHHFRGSYSACHGNNFLKMIQTVIRDLLQLVIWANHESLLVIGQNDSSRTKIWVGFYEWAVGPRDTHTSVISLDKLRNLARYSTLNLLLKHFSYTEDWG